MDKHPLQTVQFAGTSKTRIVKRDPAERSTRNVASLDAFQPPPIKRNDIERHLDRVAWAGGSVSRTIV